MYTRQEEERLQWDRKEAEYMTNLEKAEREAEAAAGSLSHTHTKVIRVHYCTMTAVALNCSP